MPEITEFYLVAVRTRGVCVCACELACACACVCLCVRVCVRMCMWAWWAASGAGTHPRTHYAMVSTITLVTAGVATAIAATESGAGPGTLGSASPLAAAADSP